MKPTTTPSTKATIETPGRQPWAQFGSPIATPSSTALPLWFAGNTSNSRVKPIASTEPAITAIITASQPSRLRTAGASL